MNVDSLLAAGGGEVGDQAAMRVRAEEIFQQLNVPFELGFADRNLMNRIEALQLHLFDNSHPLLLPCSLLIDKNGALAAFYRGAVAFDQIADDVQSLGLDMEERIAYALPFSGRWRARLGSPNVPAIGNAFVRAGYPDDLLEVYQVALLGQPENVALRRQFRGSCKTAVDIARRWINESELPRLSPTTLRIGWSGARAN